MPVGSRPPPFDFTWSFVILDAPNGWARLLVRERYAYTRAWARLLVEPTEIMSFIMSQKMLRGIRDRAEASLTSSEPLQTPGTARSPSYPRERELCDRSSSRSLPDAER